MKANNIGTDVTSCYVDNIFWSGPTVPNPYTNWPGNYWWDTPPYYIPWVTTTTTTITTTSKPESNLTKSKSDSAVPYANITVNKNRLKRYADGIGVENGISYSNCVVYLDDATGFEIELFNPTTDTYAAKFKINESYISDSSLIIHPGQRIHLDRYLDDNKKFAFYTYTVDANNVEVSDAIRNNGLIEVEFYKKRSVVKHPVLRSNDDFKHLTSAAIGTGSNFYHFAGLSDLSESSVTYGITDELSGSMRCDNTTETGIVGEGSSSDTTFQDVHLNLETTVSTKSVIKILPISQKPLEAKDLAKHCTDCGKKAKKDHKFCSNCGTKI